MPERRQPAETAMVIAYGGTLAFLLVFLATAAPLGAFWTLVFGAAAVGITLEVDEQNERLDR